MNLRKVRRSCRMRRKSLVSGLSTVEVAISPAICFLLSGTYCCQILRIKDPTKMLLSHDQQGQVEASQNWLFSSAGGTVSIMLSLNEEQQLRL